MGTVIQFIIGAALVQIAFILQLKDYTALGKDAKLFSVTNLGLTSMSLYAFAFGVLCNVLLTLYEKCMIPIFFGDGTTQEMLSVILLALAINFGPTAYAYNIHKIRMLRQS